MYKTTKTHHPSYPLDDFAKECSDIISPDKSLVNNVDAYGLERKCGGFIVNRMSYCSWTSCLASVTGYVGYKNIYLFFPAQWQREENVGRYCTFLSTHFGLNISYVGVRPLNVFVYGCFSEHAINSHVICMGQEAAYTEAPILALIKVTLLRYLYRRHHYENIITPLYEMVDEARLNPWDALVLAHQYMFDSKECGQYNPERGLMFATPGVVSMLYPRSYKELVKYASDLQHINNIWSYIYAKPDHWTKNHIYEESILTTHNKTNIRKFIMDECWPYSQYFKTPHLKIFYDDFSITLKERNWSLAFKLYVDYVIQYKSLVHAMWSNSGYHNIAVKALPVSPYLTNLSAQSILPLVIGFLSNLEQHHHHQQI